VLLEVRGLNMAIRRIWLPATALLLGSSSAGMAAEAPVGTAVEAPTAVSPGDTAKPAVVESRCPTFSWGAVAETESYELALYRLGDEAAPVPVPVPMPERVLRETVSGSASSWTPSLDRCLDRGSRYAWSVRAMGQGVASEWSNPSLFEVAARPSEVEFKEALEFVRSYLETRSVGSAQGAVAGTRAAPEAGAAEGSAGADVGWPEEELISIIPPHAFQIVGSSGDLTVVGEVRTVDSAGEPRLWGRGRPGGVIYEGGDVPCHREGVNFGLTKDVATWGQAADVCPAGSWVCRRGDVSDTACYTSRPRGGQDYYLCDGTVATFDSAQSGWLAEAPDSNFFRPRTFSEAGVLENIQPGFITCTGLPVWCCWE
jgi:hypothetical protein